MGVTPLMVEAASKKLAYLRSVPVLRSSCPPIAQIMLGGWLLSRHYARGYCWPLHVSFLGTGKCHTCAHPFPQRVTNRRAHLFPRWFPGRFHLLVANHGKHLLGPPPPEVRLEWLPSLEFRQLLHRWRLQRFCQACNIRTSVCHQV